MLLLLGDAFLMVRFVSVVFRLPGSRIWQRMTWWHLTFSDLSHIRRHAGAYFRPDEIYRSWGSCVLILICGMYAEMMIYSLSSRWSLSGAYRVPSSQARAFRCLDVVMLPSEGRLFDMWVWFSCRHRWFELIFFFNMLHSRCHTRAYSPSWSRFIDPHWFTWSSTVMRYTPGWWFGFILSGYSEELLLSRSVSFILFDIVVIPRWSYLRCLDLPRHHFSGVHIRSFTHPHGVILGLSGQIGYIWCHTGAYFPHLATEVVVLSHVRHNFHHSAEIHYIRLADHYSWALHRYELSAERRSRLVESLSAISQWIEICSGMSHWGIPPHPWVY